MLRSFLTRLVGSAPRSLLLPPSLAICLACATSFPVENLEKGMTAETVLENFGLPETVDRPMDATTWAAWTYVHEEQFWFVTVKGRVVLHFEEEELVRWKVIGPVPVVSSGSGYSSNSTFYEQQQQWQWQQQQRIKDIKHHKKGHTHHHGH